MRYDEILGYWMDEAEYENQQAERDAINEDVANDLDY